MLFCEWLINVFNLGLILLWSHCLNPQYVFSGVSRHWSGHGQRTYIPPTNIDPENHKISQVFILGDGICKSTPKPIWYHVMILQYIMNTQFVVAADLRNTLVTWRLTFRWAFPAAHLWPQPFCWAPAMSFDRAGHGRSGSCIKTGWWFGTVYIFPYIGNNNPIWLIFFRGVGIPPTRKHMETGHRLMVSDVWWQ